MLSERGRGVFHLGVRLLSTLSRGSQHRTSHQGLPEGGYASREHEKQRGDAKVRYRLADLQP
jgi:hypothetical protein